MTEESPGAPGGGTPEDVRHRLAEVFGERVSASVPLAGLTTFRTGGAADWLLETSDPADIVAAVRVTRVLDLPLTVFGGGSNVLVGDGGVRGLVVRVRHGAISAHGTSTVRADGGVTLNGLVRWAIQRGMAGLERWAGTPGTVGGAIYGNAHFDGLMVGDIVAEVGLVDRTGSILRVSGSEMAFGYDESRVQHTGEFVLWANFDVAAGDPAKLRAAARESLGFRKRTQPLAQASAGCVFQNPRVTDDSLSGGVPRTAGALIDGAGLKGCRVGGAVVSTIHGNFIVSDGAATSADVRTLIEHCRSAVVDRFGVLLREELVYIGVFG